MNRLSKRNFDDKDRRLAKWFSKSFENLPIPYSSCSGENSEFFIKNQICRTIGTPMFLM